MSYMVHGSSAYSSGSHIVTQISGTASLHDNYFDFTGAYGALYPNPFPAGSSITIGTWSLAQPYKSGNALYQIPEGTYIFGAVCPKDGKGAALILPACNIEAMNHLAALRWSHQKAHAVP